MEDATGYPLVEGDPIAYMKSTVYNMCDGFETGVITINGAKRAFERVVVINW